MISQVMTRTAWAAAVTMAISCAAPRHSTDRVRDAADSLGLTKQSVQSGPYAVAEAESVFRVDLDALDHATGSHGACGDRMGAWTSSSGSIWLFLRGPDQLLRDTVGWRQRREWGVTVIFDSTDQRGCRRAA